jgi:N utilization substance protein A
MNPSEMLRIVDSVHRDKSIDKELVFQAIETALVTAAKKHYGELADVQINIDRETGVMSGTHDGAVLDPEEISGRIGAQTAKQVIIQKIREAERDQLLGEYGEQVGTLINGVVTRAEGGATIVSLGTLEAILPRSEQIPGESHHPNERVRAIIFEVKPAGSRVKVVLSRTKPQFVQRLFEQEIPEIADGVIMVNAIAREPAHRSKVAVSSSDARVDCVGACVGVRGNRIKNIVDELAGERIDIVRWSDDAETLIRAALQPAEVDQVLLCDMIGRAIVLVREDQLSLAIGRKGQNVRLASKLCGWDIEIMTNEELEEQIDRAVTGFSQIEGMTEELAQKLVEQGYLSYDDLSVIEPDALMEMGGLTQEQVDVITNQAEALGLEAEKAAAEEKYRKKQEDAVEAIQANKAAKEAAAAAALAAAAPPAPAAAPAAEVAPAEAPPEAVPPTASEEPPPA